MKPRLQQIRLLALDVDGTLTDGGLYYTADGQELKKFNAKDGQGLKLLMAQGIQVAWITASSAVVTWHRARNLGIPYILLDVEDKLSALKELCYAIGITLDQVAYMGDDVNDLEVLQQVGLPLAPADAVLAVRNVADYITALKGGEGAVREVCDLILAARLD